GGIESRAGKLPQPRRPHEPGDEGRSLADERCPESGGVPALLRHQTLRDAAQERGLADLPRALRRRGAGAEMSRLLPIATVETEVAYDALLDSLSLVSRLIQSPCTIEELASEFPDGPSTEQLEHLPGRLVRSGIVRQEGNLYDVAAPVVVAHRQGGQLDFLREVYVPALLGLVAQDSEGMLLPIHLSLTQEEQEGLLSREVLPLLQEFSRIADESGESGPDRYVFVAGTPDVPQDRTGFDLAMEIVRTAAMNRADPSRKSRSLLTYFQTRLANAGEIHRAILEFESRMEPRRARPAEANYVLLVGAGTKARKGTFK